MNKQKKIQTAAGKSHRQHVIKGGKVKNVLVALFSQEKTEIMFPRFHQSNMPCIVRLVKISISNLTVC